MHRVVASLSVVAHLAVLAFMLVGGVVAWFRPWVLVPHVATALWGARMVLRRPECPLSRAENWARRGAGRDDLHEEGFIAHYLVGRVYPTSWARRVELTVGVVVVASWIGCGLRRRR